MHELSIALKIVETLEEELADQDDLTVSVVAIQVGALTGLVPEALQFVWEPATQNTRLHGAQLRIERRDAVGFCPACQADRVITDLPSIRCPVCRTPIRQIVGGHELEILTVEVLTEVSEDES